jgi:putative tricarboxylic transport membrane protein
VQRSDRWVGLALAALALAVLWTAREFPQVPGQKLGAAFLPLLIGAGLLLCALALIARSLRPGAYRERRQPVEVREHYGSSAVIVGAVLVYIFFAERIGFLLVAPLCLLPVFLVLRVRWLPALLWTLGGTVLVHLAFYKLLRVPLPWGWIPPFY